jgi:hypothetical protein
MRFKVIRIFFCHFVYRNWMLRTSSKGGTKLRDALGQLSNYKLMVDVWR